jgi:hypothetical protein
MLLIFAIDLVVILVLVGVAKRRGLEAALPYFAFIVTLLPEECRIPIPGLFDLYGHRLALVIVAILFFSSGVPKTNSPLPLKQLILLHTGWVLVSSLTSIVILTSAKQLLAQVLEYYLIYYIFLKTIRNPRTLWKIAFAMTTAMAVACIFGLFEIYKGWTVLSVFPIELQQTYGTGDAIYAELIDRGIRVRSTFPHPILFGGALSMMVPLALYLLTTAQTKMQKVVLNLSILLIFWNLYKTSSRGPWLATILSISLLLLAAKSKIRKQIVAAAVFAAAVLLIRPGVADTLWNTYRATLNPETQMGASYGYRSALFHTVTQALGNDPVRAIFGFGLGSFRERGLVIVLPRIATHRWYTCDSSWVLFMYETGYIGFVILVTLLFKPAIVAWRDYRNLPKKDRAFSLVCFSSFVSFFFVMIAVAMYGWGQNGYMLWMLISITISYSMLKKELRRLKQLSKTAPLAENLAVPLGRGSLIDAFLTETHQPTRSDF